MSQIISYQIVDKLWHLNRIFCSKDYDKSLDYLKTILPLKIHEYRSKEPYKGWVVPPKWELIKGTISHRGQTIYSVDHPLKIIGLSLPFQGRVSSAELKKHLHFDQRDPHSVPYHFRQHYRPWEREWGFCVPKTFYDSIEEQEEYDVEIVTTEAEGSLKIAEYVHKGRVPEGFAFVAHLDHPGMANDDLAGVAVGVELFSKLRQAFKETKFTYRLVLVQEMVGSVFYLDDPALKEEKQTILESCFLEMLGSNTSLALQSSREAKSVLEQQLEAVIEEKGITYSKGPFRAVICNDEAVWESSAIPMSSLSRFPYPEYHSDRDNPSMISERALEEAVDLFYETVLRLEQETLMIKHFDGVLALAHPQYGLYVDPGQVAFSALPQGSTPLLRRLMDEIPLLPKKSFVGAVARGLNCPLDLALDYLRKFEEKGLVTLV